MSNASAQSSPFDVPVVKNYFGLQIYSNPPSFTRWTGLPSLFSFVVSKFRDQDDSVLPSQQVLDFNLPIIRPVFQLDKKLSATWLGHATLYVRLDGISILTDPVWADVVGPHNLLGCFRYRQSPCPIEDLPVVNIVVISHNHYDHLDDNAIQKLYQHFPDISFFVPAGLKNHIQRLTGGNESIIHEMSWGESREYGFLSSKYQIWSVPAQHWSLRGSLLQNTSLWCGWAIVGPENRFFYSGDTGFCDKEFKKLGEFLGPFDLSAIPIGCYSPRYLLRAQHIDPQEAVATHKLIRSMKSIAVHWGTYKMFGTKESYIDPKTRLEAEVMIAGLPLDAFITLNHGGTWTKEESHTPT